MNAYLTTAQPQHHKKQRGRGLLPVLGIAFFLTLGASAAFAGEHPGYARGGGYTGPGPQIVSIEQAKGMRDDAHVALRGRITQSLGGERYVFEDATGSITVEIEGETWQGLSIGPDDLVEIHGEVDKDWTHMEIEVERVQKL